MGEHQCPHCGHITTGFEEQEFRAAQHAAAAKDAELLHTQEQSSAYKNDYEVEQRKRLAAEAALREIAAYSDKLANETLKATGSYSGFDEPASVKIARAALE